MKVCLFFVVVCQLNLIVNLWKKKVLIELKQSQKMLEYFDVVHQQIDIIILHLRKHFYRLQHPQQYLHRLFFPINHYQTVIIVHFHCSIHVRHIRHHYHLRMKSSHRHLKSPMISPYRNQSKIVYVFSHHRYRSTYVLNVIQLFKLEYFYSIHINDIRQPMVQTNMNYVYLVNIQLVRVMSMQIFIRYIDK